MINMQNHTKYTLNRTRPSNGLVRNYLVICRTLLPYIMIIAQMMLIEQNALHAHATAVGITKGSISANASVALSAAAPSASPSSSPSPSPSVRMRSAKIANIHGYHGGYVTTETISKHKPKNKQEKVRHDGDDAKTKHQLKDSKAKQIAGKYEIRSVAGEPNYKTVNLTWEVEFVPAYNDKESDSVATNSSKIVNAVQTSPNRGNGNNNNNVVNGNGVDVGVNANVGVVTNSSAEVEPPKAFQIFFCEMQSFGPHRCRSKLVNSDDSIDIDKDIENVDGDEQAAMTDNNRNDNQQKEYHKANNNHANTTMEKKKRKKAINRNIRHYAIQIDNLRMATKYSFHIRPQQKRRNMKITARSEFFGNEIDDGPNAQGQTIIIPTKGFSAQATQCLPHASEIEVETGPYFGGKIVVDGGNCGVKGNPEDPVDKYMMRIDHKKCGSLVKPETNTVETFITVQENLGIFTHSTRRFVVVCSFQSGMQTVRASFTVPGKGGVAAPVENDPFEPDQDRVSREQRQMHYVDRSALVLKEPSTEEVDDNSTASEESEAMVAEVEDTTLKNNTTESDAVNSVSIVENILPGVNEEHIKHESQHENEVFEKATRDAEYQRQGRLAKYAKLVANEPLNTDNDSDSLKKWFHRENTNGKALSNTLEYISANAGSVILTLSASVIILLICMYIIYREATQRQQKRQRLTRGGSNASSNDSRTIPRSLHRSH